MTPRSKSRGEEEVEVVFSEQSQKSEGNDGEAKVCSLSLSFSRDFLAPSCCPTWRGESGNFPFQLLAYESQVSRTEKKFERETMAATAVEVF